MSYIGEVRGHLGLLVGGATASAVAVFGWLELELATTAETTDASIRELGTMLTVVFGAFAALCWNQSARLPMDSQQASPAGSSVDAFFGAPAIRRRSSARWRVISFCRENESALS